METDLKRVYLLGTRRHKDNRNFLRWLKYKHPWTMQQVMKLQRKLTERVWSVVDCTKCGNCCAQMQLQLTAADCGKVARAAGVSLEEFRDKFTEKHRDGYWYLRDQPCAFLERRTCTIYPERPSRCRGFPYLHTNLLDDVAGMLDRAPYCPLVFNVIEEMKAHPELQRQRRRKR